MSTILEQKHDSDEQKDSSSILQSRNCLYCGKSYTDLLFAPYCSMKCAKTGIQKRYTLLRTFIDFEEKYINPPKKQETPLVIDSTPSKKGEESNPISKQEKK